MDMKNIYLLIACLAGFVSFSSCSDWFDVSPKTDVKASELFETEYGFQSALAGIYVYMTAGEVYGHDMSYGLVEQMSQLYDMVPTEAGGDETALYRYDINTKGYNTKDRLAGMWQQSYKVIANANNLLKWLDLNGERVISNPDTRNALQGEALGIRAYLHFDLLRGWGPVDYATHKDALSIPYRLQADNSKQPLLSAEKVVENILKDCRQAKECLKNEANSSLEDSQRRFRMNYHAVNALMARVSLYANDKTTAVRCAKEVIDNCGLSLAISNENDPVLSQEIVFGVNLYKMDESITGYFSDGDKYATKYYSQMSTFDRIFDEGDVDFRSNLTSFIKRTADRVVIARKYIENNNAIVPLVRLSEMYYIACEATYKEGDSQAVEESEKFLNTVRNKRGYSIAMNETFWDHMHMVTCLEREYRRDFYAEGRCFYFYKEHADIISKPLNCPFEEGFGEAQYVFPLPDREKEYGWTNPEEVTEESEIPENE